MKSVTLNAAPARNVLGAILGVLVFSVALFAQGSYGRILGTVTDQTGAVLTGATVTVTDTERGLARTLNTDSAGEYNAPNLIPGTYTVRVAVKGFKVLARENIVLEVGKEVRVDLTPQTGDQTQTVTVTEQIPLVDTATSNLGGTLNNADINDLPLNGRNYQALLGLRPGVMLQPGGSPWTQSTNGIRPDETTWMVEGVINSTMDAARPVANISSPLTDGAGILPVDAIQEFNMQENPKAEYGWKPGAVVNVGIRSGTNTPHGSAYAFGRSDSWDARNLFNPGLSPSGVCVPNPGVPVQCDKLGTQLEQFGGVAGFRIKKDKLFFFGGYEGLRSTVGNPFVGSMPATGPGLGPENSMPDAIAALQAKGIPVSPVSLNLFGCTPSGATYGCTGGLISGAAANSNTYVVAFPNTNVSDNEIGKIDYRLSDKHSLSTMFWQGNYNGNGQDHGGVNTAFEDTFHIRVVTSVTNWIWTPSSSVVNEARFATTRQTFNQLSDDATIPANGLGGLCTPAGCGGKGYPLNSGVTNPIALGMTTVNIGNFTAGGGQVLGTYHNRPSYSGPNPYYVYQDSVSFLRGKHALKVGGEYTHIIVNGNAADTIRGRVDFNGGQAFKGSTPLEDYFAGTPTDGQLLAGPSLREFHWHVLSGFVQDDWRIVPRLMLNLGMRYEFKSPMEEARNFWGNFSPTLGLVQQGQPGVGSSVIKPDYGNLSPRFGFAWDITGKGTTVIRGGSSIMYTTFVTGQFGSQLGAQNFTSNALGSIPTGACRISLAPGAPCPDGQTLGGTLQLGTAAYGPSAVNWDPKVNANPGLNGGTVFPQAGLSCTTASPCNIGGVNPNLKTPYIVGWHLGVQRVITPNLSLEVGFVGNHGDNLTGYRDINQCPPNTAGKCVNSLRPYAATFPYLKFINYTSGYGYSNYESLQATLTKRVSHGLNFTAGYTYAHDLDNGSIGRFGLLPQNSNNTNAEYGPGDFDIRHRLTFTAGYAIPGKNGFGQLLKGWKINSILTLQTAQPWNVSDYSSNGMSYSGTGDKSDRWDLFGTSSDFHSGSQSIPYCSGFTPGQGLNGVTCSSTSGISGIVSPLSSSMAAPCLAKASDPTTLANGGCYVSTNGKSVITPPMLGTFGTMGRNLFRDAGFKNLDASLFKDFKFKERFTAQFRVEMFNIFNHPLVANPWGSQAGVRQGIQLDRGNSFGCGCSTPDVATGNPLIGSGGARDVQLGLKLTF